ncbi:MAG: Ig-like domain repeat protein [Candidatus Sulfotelmatobacter sp.]
MLAIARTRVSIVLIALAAQLIIVAVPMVAQQAHSSSNGLAAQSGPGNVKSNASKASRPGISLLLPPTFYASGPSWPGSIAVADLNGDGKLDVVVGDACGAPSCPNGNDVAVLLGKGDGTFQSTVMYNTGSDGTTTAQALVGDLNGDGKPDLLVLHGFNINTRVSSISVLFGNGDGTFQPPIVSQSGGTSTPSMLADVNGDGKLDLIVTDSDGGVTVSLGNGDGTFRPGGAYSSGNSLPNALSVRDVNGDGKLDLIVADTGPSWALLITVGVLLGNGDGTFRPVASYDVGGKGNGPIAMTVGDVDGDGKPDILVAEDTVFGQISPGEVAVLLNNGDGTFKSPMTYDAGGRNVEGIALADMNDDGKLDAIVANCYLSPCSGLQDAAVLLGNGDGTFQPAQDYDTSQPPPQTFLTPIAVADLNGDDEPDVIVGGCLQVGCGNNQIAVLLHTGSASTTTSLAAAPNPSTFGQLVTFTAAVTSRSGAPTGTVIFYEGANEAGIATLANGTASASSNSLLAGSQSLTAAYQGSVEFSSSQSAPLIQVVNPAVTSTSVVSSSNPAPINTIVNYTASVTTPYGGQTGGFLTLTDNGAQVAMVAISNNQARYKTSYNVGGKHSIIATYSGDSDNIGSTSPTLIEYVPATTSTALSSNLNPSIYGQTVSFTATVTPTGSVPLTGSVSFSWNGNWFGSTPLNSSGVATFPLSTLNAQTFPIVATYKGDNNNAASTSPVVNQVVTQATTSTTLTSKPNPSTQGEAVTLTATITSPTAKAKGPVTFTVGKTVLGTAQLSQGSAKFTTSTLPVGSTTVTATYSGDSDIKGSAASITQVVQ